MNICIVSSWLPSKSRPDFAPFVYTFAENMGRFGIKVSVIGPSSNLDEPITITEFMTIYRVNPKFPLISFFSLFDKIKPDIVHVHAPNFFSCNVIPAAKLKKIPIIATVHRAEVQKIGYPTFLFRKHALECFQKVIAVSNHTRLLAIEAGVEASKIMTIYNSCDENLFLQQKDKESLRIKNNFQSKDKIILFVGNLIKRKGVDFLIESLKLVHDKTQEFVAIIVGQGEERNNLESLVNTHQLKEHVKFYGRITNSELSELYAIADIFVLPSISEGHSVAVLEAMASGLTVIASDINGNKESIDDGVNGLLFETGNVENLAEKLVAVLVNQKLRDTLSTNGSRTYFEKFSVKKQMNGYLEIYNSLIK